MNFFRTSVSFFDKMEDKIRARLARLPILYAFLGGVGVVLFWKGVWESAEYFALLDGVGSLILGTLILLSTGLLVSVFIGDSIIMSGFKREKKLVEKTESEIFSESELLEEVDEKIDHLESEVHELLNKKTEEKIEY